MWGIIFQSFQNFLLIFCTLFCNNTLKFWVFVAQAWQHCVRIIFEFSKFSFWQHWFLCKSFSKIFRSAYVVSTVFQWSNIFSFEYWQLWLQKKCFKDLIFPVSGSSAFFENNYFCVLGFDNTVLNLEFLEKFFFLASISGNPVFSGFSFQNFDVVRIGTTVFSKMILKF